MSCTKQLNRHITLSKKHLPKCSVLHLYNLNNFSSKLICWCPKIGHNSSQWCPSSSTKLFTHFRMHSIRDLSMLAMGDRRKPVILARPILIIKSDSPALGQPILHLKMQTITVISIVYWWLLLQESQLSSLRGRACVTFSRRSRGRASWVSELRCLTSRP